MADLQINVYAFLGVLEFTLLLLVVSLVFIVRSIKLAGRLRVVQGKLKKAEQMPEPVTFDQYLRDEVIHNQDLIERAAASQDDTEKKVAEVMNMRKQFLELEVEARALENNPIAFQDKLAAGLSELIERLRPEAKLVMEPVVEAVETIPQVEAAAAEQRKLLDTHDAEFDRLKAVINNQQDAMKTLRSELQARENEIDGPDAGMQKLDEFERQSTKLQQCLDVLEKETEYITQDQHEKTAEQEVELAVEAVSELPQAEDEIALQDEKHELEIKVQELEALLEFKDAAIEELEKQYSKLEARFLAASAEKKVD